MIGQTIGHFEILEKLGEGGMGVVWKARDERLDRFVALKLLPPEKVADPERKRRFIQEAKAASALNHPNIITIYEIDTFGGVDFIAMEFVAGKTLDSLIPRKGLRLNEALRYAIQIAAALAAAHAAGIVHRDLKPGNIMVTENGPLKGLVKVLDFGLAKLTETAATTEFDRTRTLANQPQTDDGVILGTASYMSPEQAEGKKVDARSDIFAFGAVLYEMVTGQRAFAEGSKTATLAAILNKEPKPPAEIAEGLPHDLEKIILRCLRKDPARRAQSMMDLKLALDELKEESESGRLSATTPASPPRSRNKLYWAAALTLAIVAGVAGAFWPRPRPSTAPSSGMKLTRLTSDSGLSWQPAISPDGKLIAYASDRAGEGNLDIWVKQLAGGEPARLTNDPADDYEPDFSPDGSQIAFRSDRNGGGIYVVSTLGGEARLLARQGTRPKFSPDGRTILYSIGSTFSDADSRRAYVIPSAGGSPKRVQPDFFFIANPCWMPDGKHILFEGRSQTGRGWWVAPIVGGPAVNTSAYEKLLAHRFRSWDLAQWSPARDAAMFSAQAGDSTNLWEISLSPETWKVTGEPRRLTTGTGREIAPAVAANGRIAFASVNSNVDVWSLPVDANRGKVTGELVRLTSDAASDRTPSLSPDGDMLVFDSDRSGAFHIWRKDLQTGKESVLTTTPSVRPVISPDETRVAYSCREEQKIGICVLSLRDGSSALICEGCGTASDWSADGKSILYWVGFPGGKAPNVSLLDPESRKSVVLLHHEKYGMWDPRMSPDGRWIVFHFRADPTNQKVIIAPVRPGSPPPESEWIFVTDGAGMDRRPAWSPDGNLVYFTSERDGFRCIWAQRLDPATKKPSGEPFAVYHAHSARRALHNIETVGYFALSAVRDRLIFANGELTANIWTFDLPAAPGQSQHN